MMLCADLLQIDTGASDNVRVSMIPEQQLTHVTLKLSA